MGRLREGSRYVQGRLLAVVCASFGEFQGPKSGDQEERCLVGISLDVKKNGVCLVPDVQLLQVLLVSGGESREKPWQEREVLKKELLTCF